MSSHGQSKTGFTLIELLVVIAIITALMAILVPCLQGARRRAGAAACQARLRQWGLAFRMYTDENRGRWFQWDKGNQQLPWARETIRYWQGAGKVRLTPGGHFTSLERSIALCPVTGVDKREVSLRAYTAKLNVGPWDYLDVSYGFNYWLCSGGPRWGEFGPSEPYWQTSDVREAARIPVLGDSFHPDLMDSLWGCYHNQPPPRQEGYSGGEGTNWIFWCINRHIGGINMLFMDGSVRKVGLKELWTLKWSRTFDTAGHWTKAGGVKPEKWPAWMQRFKDY